MYQLLLVNNEYKEIRNDTLVSVNFSVQDASISKIFVPSFQKDYEIIKDNLAQKHPS